MHTYQNAAVNRAVSISSSIVQAFVPALFLNSFCAVVICL